MRPLSENEVARIAVDAAVKVHKVLGPGLLESVYETVLERELLSRGLCVDRQRPIPLVYEDMRLDQGFRADLVLNGIVIVEIKSVETVPLVAYKILLTYLRLSDMRLGLLINFGENLIKDGIKRVVNRMPD